MLYACQAEPGFWTNSVSRWRELRDEQERMIDAIRAESPRACIAVSGTEWSKRVDWMLGDPVRRENIFVKSHMYDSLESGLKHNGIVEVAERHPVIIGEFGTGGRMINEDSLDLIKYAEKKVVYQFDRSSKETSSWIVQT